MSQGEGGGRPTILDDDLADTICRRLAHGESLRSICRDDAMPDISTVLEWVVNSKNEAQEKFSKQYAKAREAQAEYLADEINDIADDGSNDWIERETEKRNIVEQVNGEVVARSRLRVDTRKWYLSKVLPKKYGERLVMAGDKDNPVEISFKLDDNAKNTIREAVRGLTGQTREE